MSLFNSIASQVAGAVGQQANGQEGAAVMQALGGLLNDSNSGGLTGLVTNLNDKGMGSLLESWMGSGANLPISGDQVQQVLGGQQLASMASSLGLPAAQIPDLVARYLPQVIDMLTPDGKLPDGAALGQLGNIMGMLRK
jgi:uncharacterized protein YidB (DUF937 family)